MRLSEPPIRPKAPGAAPAAKRRSVGRVEQANRRAAMRAMVARFLSAQLDEDRSLTGPLGDEAEGRALVTALAVSGNPAALEIVEGLARTGLHLAAIAARRTCAGFPLTAAE